MNRSSIPLIIAVLFLLAGGLFLSENLGGPSLWKEVLPLWPLLLVLVGLWAVIRAIVNQRKGVSTSPWVWVGEALFAVFIIGLGMVFNFVKSSDFDLPFIEPSFTVSSSTAVETIPIKPGAKLIIENRIGKIQIDGWDGDKAQAFLVKKAGGVTKQSARRKIKSVRLKIIRQGKNYKVEVKHPKTFGNLPFFFSSPKGIELQIKVPRKVSVDARTDLGFVRIRDHEGDVRARSDLGAISADDIKGRVKLETDLGSIKANNISGNLVAFTDLGSIDLNKVKGNIEAKSDLGSVKIKNPGKRVKASTDLGSISVTYMRGPFKPADIRSSNGALRLVLPHKTEADIFAEADLGDIETVGSIDEDSDEEGPGESVRAEIGGGGPLISLRTDSGRITIVRRR